MVYLTRLEHFNAAHKLYNPEWSREKNEAVFGVCANENWHGHNFELFITIKGEIENLNMDVDFLQGKMCSTEVLAMEVWKQLDDSLPSHVSLHCVKLYETPRIYVEYFGD